MVLANPTDFVVHCGDALEVLKTLPSESVNCCITSPPYYGLRDYGVDGQIGLDQTLGQYVERLVTVFREMHRVLRDDGTFWLNIGDSYAGSWGNYGGQNRGRGKQREITSGSQAHQRAYDGLERWRPPTSMKLDGLKSKDLIGIPWMLAFALRADGWYLQSEIIWHKPNPMPESVKDRPTKAHEQIFLLSKSPKYCYNYEALNQFLDTRIDLGLDNIGGTQDRPPAAAESGEKMRNQALLVLHGEREPHTVRLPLGNIEQPRARFVHRSIVRNALEDHAFRHGAPGGLPSFPQMALAAFWILGDDSEPVVDIQKAAQVPTGVRGGIDEGETGEAEFLHAGHKPLVELGIGACAEEFLRRSPARRQTGCVGFQDDAVVDGDAGTVAAHEDEPRELQTFVSFGFGTQDGCRSRASFRPSFRLASASILCATLVRRMNTALGFRSMKECGMKYRCCAARARDARAAVPRAAPLLRISRRVRCISCVPQLKTTNARRLKPGTSTSVFSPRRQVRSVTDGWPGRNTVAEL